MRTRKEKLQRNKRSKALRGSEGPPDELVVSLWLTAPENARKLGLGGQNCTLRGLGAEAGGLQDQSLPGLQSQIKPSLGNL